MIENIEAWVTALASSPWILIILFAFIIIDAFFPPIPSESLVIALAAISVSAGTPSALAIIVVAAAGAFIGDIITYGIGRRYEVHRLKFLRGEKIQKAFTWADKALRARAAPFIIAARYIPVGRVAVNMTAGSLKYPARRFGLLAALAAATWAGYSVLIGSIAATWFEGHSLIAIVVGVTAGVLTGLGVDACLRAYDRRNPSAADAREAGEEIPSPAS